MSKDTEHALIKTNWDLTKKLQEQQDLINRLKEKEDAFDNVYIALFNLVNLKSHKDMFGKTDFYNKEQPLCWKAAREALTGRVYTNENEV